jgi:hypothetical protein
LNINGIRSADVGDKASNVIPTEASATLDLRQVLGTDYLRQIQKVKDHIVSQGFYVIDRNPTDEERLKYAKIAKVTADRGGYNAQRTPMDLPIAKQIIAAVQGATKEKVLTFLFESVNVKSTVVINSLSSVGTTSSFLHEKFKENKIKNKTNFFMGLSEMQYCCKISKKFYFATLLHY